MSNGRKLGIHLLFTFNHAPYDKNGLDPHEFAMELKKLSETYDLDFYSFFNNTMSFLASRKK